MAKTPPPKPVTPPPRPEGYAWTSVGGGSECACHWEYDEVSDGYVLTDLSPVCANHASLYLRAYREQRKQRVKRPR